MKFEGDIPVTYSHGVLRPEMPLSLPENARLRISIVRVERSKQQLERSDRALERLRKGGVMRMDGWHPRRDELYERL